MKKLFLIIAAGSMALLPTYAEQLSPQEALLRAMGSPAMATQRSRSQGSPRLVHTAQSEGLSQYYVFNNAGSGSGFAIVSADDQVTPVLGYSDTGSFDANNMPEPLKGLLAGYQEQIALIQEGKAKPASRSDIPNRAPIEPLIKTSWGQNAPFNDKCLLPDGQKAVTGCVPTAMAQIMKYWKWPERGEGENSYELKYNGTSYTLSQDFSQVKFDWDNMIDDYNVAIIPEKAPDAIATLMRTCGIAFNSKYGLNGTSTNTDKARQGMITHFRYQADEEKYLYTFKVSEWEEMIYNELLEGRPIYYTSANNNTEHAYVCDGYNNGYFHFNLGWDGFPNGYFLVTAMDFQSQDMGYEYAYSRGQSMITGIAPAKLEGTTNESIIYFVGNGITIQESYDHPNDYEVGDYFSFKTNLKEIHYLPALKFVSPDGKIQYITPKSSFGGEQQIDPETDYFEWSIDEWGVIYGNYEKLYFPKTYFPKGDYDIYPAWYRNGTFYDAKVGYGNNNVVHYHNDGITIEFQSAKTSYKLKIKNLKQAPSSPIDYFSIKIDGIKSSDNDFEGNIKAILYKKSSNEEICKFEGIHVMCASGREEPFQCTINCPEPLTPALYELVLVDESGNPVSDRITLDYTRHVESVVLSDTDISLFEETSSQLQATVSPEDTDYPTVTWSSSNADIATVDATGKVTAVKEGTATVTATADGKSATCEVTVKKVYHVEKITLSETTLSQYEGTTATLTASVSPDNATYPAVTWNSSDASIASVDETGKVSFAKPGTATITATADGKSATCEVTVKQIIRVESIAFDNPTIEITEGEKSVLTVSINPENATFNTITWATSDETIATIAEDGTLTAVKPGTATITATADGKLASCTVTVTKRVISVTGITLNKTALSLTEGDTFTLTANVEPSDATDPSMSWSSSDASVASVDAAGKVTALKEGSASITAKAGDKTASCQVTVAKKVIAVTGVTLNKTAISLTEGDTFTLTTKVEPSDATDPSVSWSSSDANVATVDATGMVTAINEGSATITAIAGGKTASCKVTVSPKPRAQQSIKWELQSEAYVGDMITLSATSTSGLDVSYEIIYGGAYASLNGSKLNCLDEGTVTIRATQEGNEAYEAAEPVDLDIEIKKASALANVHIDSATISVYDGKIIVEGSDKPVEVYSISGRLISNGSAREITVPASGIYIVRCGSSSSKVAVK